MKEQSNLEKYPKQIAPAEIRNVAGKQTTFSIDQELYTPEEDDSPMKMYADYSRFVLAIINSQNGELKNPNANILVKEIPGIYQKTKFCNWKYWESEMQPQETLGNVSPAFSIRLAGKFSGKTAAQVLMEKGDNGKIMLCEQKEWLRKNLSGRYEKANREQIQAIDDAIRLAENGQLKTENFRNNIQILVNEPVKKYFRKTKIIDGKEYNKCYEIKIMFELGRQYPYTVKITNSYCTIRKDKTGKTMIGNENLETATGEIRLTIGQWTYYVDAMRSRMQEHSLTHYQKQEQIMQENMWKPDAAHPKYIL